MYYETQDAYACCYSITVAARKRNHAALLPVTQIDKLCAEANRFSITFDA